jgi:hypothetical protein
MDRIFSLATNKSATNSDVVSGGYLNLFQSKAARGFAESGPADVVFRLDDAFMWPLKSAVIAVAGIPCISNALYCEGYSLTLIAAN